MYFTINGLNAHKKEAHSVELTRSHGNVSHSDGSVSPECGGAEEGERIYAADDSESNSRISTDFFACRLIESFPKKRSVTFT